MKVADLQKCNLPDNPGVYFFYKGKQLLYVGKATSLKSRVRSYFAKDLIETRGPHIVDMVFKADRVVFEETDSVLEAVILEANLIKKYQPRYNTKDKDNKSFNYVVITNDPLPLVILVRGRNLKVQSEMEKINAKKIFGPYPSGFAIREGLKIIRRIFPFFDEMSIKKDNYQFYRQIGLTPDTNREDIVKSYKDNIRHICLFLEGKKKKVLAELQKKMMGHAKCEEFEQAAVVRGQIFALEHINDIALIKDDIKTMESRTEVPFRIEAYDIAHMSGKNMVGVMTVTENDEPTKHEYRKFIIRTQAGSNDTGALEEVLSRRFRHTEWGMPDLIVMDGGEAQLRIAKQVLNRYQLFIPIVSVVKDDRHKPRDIYGDQEMAKRHKKAIILANSEAHRYGIAFHKLKRGKNFLPKNRRVLPTINID
jgi:excinuclease ABC subunit C